jgi:polyhydroxyalkanoate synthase
MSETPAAAKAKKPRSPKAVPAPAAPQAPAQAAAAAPASAPAPVADAPIAALLVQQTPEQLERLSSTLAEVMMRANTVFSTAFEDQSKQQPGLPNADPFNAQGALASFWTQAMSDPENMRQATGALWLRLGQVWQEHLLRAVSGGQEAPADGKRDRRFQDPEWRSNAAFSLLRETYLAVSNWLMSLTEQVDGLDEDTKRKAAYFLRQAVEAASPSNFPLTNPAVLRATLASQGANLVQGLHNLQEDLRRGKGMLAIRQTDLEAFKVGENIATAPGKVVFRNELFELLQYAPTTETVFARPLLIFPPWINKFYILDLQPKNSMIRWLVDQGFTVFVTSWVNPDADLAEKTFENYIEQGVFAAVEAVCKATGQDAVSTVGYCIGGTLLSSALAVMADRGDARIANATFYAAQTDFEEAGELKVFTDDAGLAYIDSRIKAKGGFLDAQAMADTFNSLRANDLIWSYIVDNYYLGRKPAPFDLLFWNSDQTRMPHALHMFYLRRFYRDNALAKGELKLFGRPVSLSRVKIPVFLQAAREDHIAPYTSVYRGARLFGGPTEFLLAGSGHIAGVINPPAAKKYQHWINPALPQTPAEWLAGAQEHPGSWWPHWASWLAEKSGAQVPARRPGEGRFKALGDAPGGYVQQRSG